MDGKVRPQLGRVPIDYVFNVIEAPEPEKVLNITPRLDGYVDIDEVVDILDAD